MSRASRGELVLGAQPGIDLTPPEVKARRQGTGLRRALVMALVGAIVIVAVGYGAAFVRATAAAASLDAARAESQRLLEAQQEFSEVIKIESRTKAITTTRELVSAPEVVWKGFIDKLVSIFPADAVLTSVIASGRLASDPELVPVGALRKPLVASVTVAISTPSIPDAAAWMRRIAALPGYADHAPASVTFADGRYTTTVTVSLSADALAARFSDDADEAADEPTTEDAVGADASTTTTEGADE